MEFAGIGDAEFVGGLHADVLALGGGEFDDEGEFAGVLGDDLVDAFDVDGAVFGGVEADDDGFDFDGLWRLGIGRSIGGDFIAVFVEAAAGFLGGEQFGVVEGEFVLFGALVFGAAAAEAEDVAGDEQGLVFLVVVTPDHHFG